MRLTIKYENNYYPDVVFEKNGQKMLDMTKQLQCNKKLGQLEDIEDELDIDLVTLIKALKNGIYHNQYCGVSTEPWIFQLDLQNKRFYYHIQDMNASWDLFCDFKDYGKTWALTKEELL